MKYDLKPLGKRNLDAALEKAKHYRALNQPEEAVSICRDVLEVEGTEQEALRVLGLALTDQFGSSWVGLFEEAVAAFDALNSEYERVYYGGVAWERFARAQLAKNQVQNAAHAFEKALELYARAEKIGPPDLPDPILRWNRCVRALQADAQLLAAMGPPSYHEFQHGD